jgi:ketosteroid isomerase-like protein
MDMGVAAAALVTSEVTESGDIAVETGNYRLFAADNSEIDNGKYLVVRKLEDGEWRLHRDIWNTSKAS